MRQESTLLLKLIGDNLTSLTLNVQEVQVKPSMQLEDQFPGIYWEAVRNDGQDDFGNYLLGNRLTRKLWRARQRYYEEAAEIANEISTHLSPEMYK